MHDTCIKIIQSTVYYDFQHQFQGYSTAHFRYIFMQQLEPRLYYKKTNCQWQIKGTLRHYLLFVFKLFRTDYRQSTVTFQCFSKA